MKKKFRDDYLQRSYDQMADTFGLSKKQATEAVKALENMGIIKRIFKTIQVRGQILNNVLFIKWVPKRLYEVTFPEEIEENTLSPPKEIPLSAEGGRGIPEYSFYGRLSVASKDVQKFAESDLPPTYFCYGTRDPFVSEFEECMAALKKAGVLAGSDVPEGRPHGYGYTEDWIPGYAEWLKSVFEKN